MMDSRSPHSPEDVPYGEILTSIVQRFVQLVGAPAALNAARRIPDLQVDAEGRVLDYDRNDPLNTLHLLIEQYRSVFGDVAVTLSQQAAKPIAKQQTESILQEAGFASQMGPTRILVVDDHVLFREGIVSLLTPQSDLQVVGQAGSMAEAIVQAHELRPDLVLMDIGLPDGSGVDATKAILAERPSTKIVFLTIYEDDEKLFAAIRVGAMGYFFKNVRSNDLLKGLRSVARGEASIPPNIARRILEEFSRLPAAQPADSQSVELSAREIEIVRELARGSSNRDIAKRLVISENTVKNHVRNVLSKLHLRSRYEVVEYARAHGLLHPPSRPVS